MKILRVGFKSHINFSRPILIGTIIFFITFLLTVLLIPSRPVSNIIFDESHGPWETTLTSYEPDNFGRAYNYSYSLLRDYSQNLSEKVEIYTNNKKKISDTDSLLIIKTPTKSFNRQFIYNTYEWLKSGGRLLIILDHTDLFDMTQNTNPLLEEVSGIKVATDAVFDKFGKPNRPITSSSLRFLGRLDGTGSLIPYQTGASFEKFPLNVRTLATYGLSYSEPGDYSNLNRFGNFNTSPTYRYSDNPSIVATTVGKGMLIVFTDSTPWSNFSLPLRPYKDLFRYIIVAFESPLALKIINIGLIILFTTTILLIFIPYKFIYLKIVLLGFSMGLIYGSGSIITKELWNQPIYEKDFNLRIHLGPGSKNEFLNELIKPEEYNYSRVIFLSIKV